jgi:hypothetical protein
MGPGFPLEFTPYLIRGENDISKRKYKTFFKRLKCFEVSNIDALRPTNNLDL